ncbi:MAG: transcription termination/antitermination factor NusG [Planctomycetaceae bacterium]|nr:transcription termination/antitermination factor NusG [Planctomycetaceae bacterium]MBV8311028.1 transcription termination/antitermination factor NusG [Planctomycetaceae bacterium]
METTPEPSEPETGSAEPGAHCDSESPGPEVKEETPAGGQAQAQAAPRKRKPRPKPAPEPEPEPGPADVKEPPVIEHPVEVAAPAAADDEPQPDLVWYVLKVQSSREDTIRDALQRRVKIQGLQKFFNKIVVPTEKITEIRNNKKRIVERKTYPGYIMVQMELNEKTWFLVRETPGVGDFVGAHGTPTKMTDAEVNQMLHQEEEKTTAETPKVRIDVERGDRVKIKDGPFENFEGTVEEVIEGRGLVKVMLIIFNRPTPVDLEYWQLERI